MKISFIIPVYNIEHYLQKCIKSIQSQEFDDYEIICVNDGSTDNSLSVLKSYENEKFIIIDKINEGQGVARNVGLEKARGEYVWFVDGDDWIEDNCLKDLVSELEKSNPDILIFGGKSCYETENGGIRKKIGAYSVDKLPKKYKDKLFSSYDIRNDIFKFPSTAWSKIYRKDFLTKNNIKFQDLKVGEDQLFFFHSMITADRISLFCKHCYCYRKNRAGSAMTTKKKKDLTPIYVFYAIENLLKETGKTEIYKKSFINRYFTKATSWLAKYREDIKDEYYIEYLKLLEHIKSNYKGWWQHFNPTINDSYAVLKLKILQAKIYSIITFAG